jgi:mRNA interferase HigB
MEVLNKRIIDNFITRHAGSLDAINRWLEQIETSVFFNHNELKSIFPNADYVGKSRYVFNIKGNNYRLVAIVLLH